MMCENCPYSIGLGNDLGDLGFGCGLDYCPQECYMFDCTPEENALSHQIQNLDKMETELREEIAENLAVIRQERAEDDKSE